MRNSEMRPPGSTPVPEAHTATEDEKEMNHVQSSSGRGNKRGRGRESFGHGRGHSSGRGSFGQGHGRGHGSSFKPSHSTNPTNSTKSLCHRCGMSNYWAKTCRTPKHLIDLYQESLKGKSPETHMVYKDDEDDFDHEKDDLMEYETSDCLKKVKLISASNILCFVLCSLCFFEFVYFFA